jgi:hypothetical protein
MQEYTLQLDHFEIDFFHTVPGSVVWKEDQVFSVDGGF